MTHLEKAFGFVSASHQYISRKCNSDKMVRAARSHPTRASELIRAGAGLTRFGL